MSLLHRRMMILETGENSMTNFEFLATKKIEQPTSRVVFNLPKKCKEFYIVADKMRAEQGSQFIISLEGGSLTGSNDDLLPNSDTFVLIHLESIGNNMWVQTKRNSTYSNNVPSGCRMSARQLGCLESGVVAIETQYQIKMTSGTISIFGR